MTEVPRTTAPQLRRTLGLVALTAFGVGDILGAGVYGLVGKIAGIVGGAAWLSYVLAGFMAALTGLTYAEWTSRYPRAGGAAHFCEVAYRHSLITFLVIFFVTLSGLFSMATSTRVFADYSLARIPAAPVWIRQYGAPLVFVLLLSFVAVRGIRLSSGANALCTAIEVGGLLTILAVGARFLGHADYLSFSDSAGGSLSGRSLAVVGGASLAFFAFMGFEDLANLSEETHHPERTVPLAICLSVAITGVIYISIALVAVSVLPPHKLNATKSPLLDVVRAASPGFPGWIYTVVPAFAVFNTALLNLLMASRLLYGMSKSKSRLLPAAFGYLHPAWNTPAVGVAVSAAIVASLLLVFKDVKTLASGTASFLLVVFVLLHVGLLRIKRQDGHPPPRFHIPAAVPVLGTVTGMLLLVRQDAQALKAAGWMTVVALAFYAGIRTARGRVKVEAID